MLVRIVKKDFQRNKIITAVLFLFLMLSAVLIASASHIIMSLTGSLNHLLTVSKAPHFVQMHAGPIDERELQMFGSTNPLVQEYQLAKVLGIDGSHVFMGDRLTSEQNSVMDIGFVKQNRSFDYLLNLQNQTIHVSKGQIAVPIYYMQSKDLKIGDTVRVSNGKWEKTFLIVDFVRDVQMNPAIVSSKRFVVSDADFAALEQQIGQIEYLIEYRLTNLDKLSEFHQIYQSSNMPNKGPTIDYHLFKSLNALTDGMIVVVIVLVSILLMLIAMLCLRFTIISTMEEDLREIGVMKAIGIAQRDIIQLYLAKYMVMAALATILGYVASLGVMRLFTENISLYLGAAPNSLLLHVIPVVAVCLNFGVTVGFCRLILRRFQRITAVEALRSGTVGETRAKNSPWLSLHKYSHVNVNAFLGWKDVYERTRMFGLLIFIYAICLFIILVPIQLLHTLHAPSFISYMGVGKSDIRIDLQQSKNMEQRFAQMIHTIKNDPAVQKFSPLITSRFDMLSSEGKWEGIHVETGDFTLFPLTYSDGAAPKEANEIALSDLNAKELKKRVGDTLILLVDGKEKQMTVSGIYQDITNGGRTAKARLPHDPKTVLWYVVALDVKPGKSVQAKMNQYAQVFSPAKITHLESYLSQTLGNTIEQLQLVTMLAVLISLSFSLLITSLFLKMLMVKDRSQIAILKSIGFTTRDIQAQYMTRMLLVSAVGILLGTMAASTIGQSLVRMLWSFMGASKIQLLSNPLVDYGIVPVVFLIIVVLVTLGSSSTMRNTSIAERIG